MTMPKTSLHGTPEARYRAGMELLEALRRQAYLARMASEDGHPYEAIVRLHILERELGGLAQACAEKLAEPEPISHLSPIERRVDTAPLDRFRADLERRLAECQRVLDETEGGQA